MIASCFTPTDPVSWFAYIYYSVVDHLQGILQVLANSIVQGHFAEKYVPVNIRNIIIAERYESFVLYTRYEKQPLDNVCIMQCCQRWSRIPLFIFGHLFNSNVVCYGSHIQMVLVYHGIRNWLLYSCGVLGRLCGKKNSEICREKVLEVVHGSVNSIVLIPFVL